METENALALLAAGLHLPSVGVLVVWKNAVAALALER
jgi:hypothetical protein